MGREILRPLRSYPNVINQHLEFIMSFGLNRVQLPVL